MFDFLLPAKPTPDSVAFGEVTDDSPLTVRFNGSDAADAVSGVYRLADYTPTVGHVVLLLRVGALWVIVGRIVP